MKTDTDHDRVIAIANWIIHTYAIGPYTPRLKGKGHCPRIAISSPWKRILPGEVVVTDRHVGVCKHEDVSYSAAFFTPLSDWEKFKTLMKENGIFVHTHNGWKINSRKRMTARLVAMRLEG